MSITSGHVVMGSRGNIDMTLYGLINETTQQPIQTTLEIWVDKQQEDRFYGHPIFIGEFKIPFMSWCLTDAVSCRCKVMRSGIHLFVTWIEWHVVSYPVLSVLSCPVLLCVRVPAS